MHLGIYATHAHTKTTHTHLLPWLPGPLSGLRIRDEDCAQLLPNIPDKNQAISQLVAFFHPLIHSPHTVQMNLSVMRTGCSELAPTAPSAVATDTYNWLQRPKSVEESGCCTGTKLFPAALLQSNPCVGCWSTLSQRATKTLNYTQIVKHQPWLYLTKILVSRYSQFHTASWRPHTRTTDGGFGQNL